MQSLKGVAFLDGRYIKSHIKAVQGDGGWNSPEMVMRRYAHIVDEDRRNLAKQMEQQIYGKEKEPVENNNETPWQVLSSLIESNPEMLAQLIQSLQVQPKMG